MRKIAITLCLLTFACSASAQAVKSSQPGRSSWDNLSALQRGQKIQVVETNSRKDSGKFSSVTDSTITLQKKSGEQTIERQDVRIVRLMKNNHRLRNTFIGAGIGAGVGAGIGAATGGPCMMPSSCFFYLTRGQQAAIFAAPALVLGAVAGALWPTSEMIYRVDKN